MLQRASTGMLCVFAAAACAGNVKMTRISPATVDTLETIKGVLVYPPTFMTLTYVYTMRVDEKGNVVGGVEGKPPCTKANQKVEVAVLPDFSRPMVISNASGAFSAAKFAVTLNIGMLASVNAEPTQKTSDVLTAIAPLIKEFSVAEGGASDPLPICNSSPVLESITPTPVGSQIPSQ